MLPTTPKIGDLSALKATATILTMASELHSATARAAEIAIKTKNARRRRAEARAKWPMYMADVAYRIERLPPPRRAYGRTWAQLARDSFLGSFPPGIPPWACEALKPEFRPRTMTLAELLAPYTEDELAAYYY